MYEDNSACIILSKGEGKFIQSKYIGIRYHYLRRKIGEGEIILKHINDQLDDVLHKPLINTKLNQFMHKMISKQGELERWKEHQKCSVDFFCVELYFYFFTCLSGRMLKLSRIAELFSKFSSFYCVVNSEQEH